MSKTKFTGLKLGNGDYANKNYEVEVFVGSNWSSSNTYANNDIVLYSGTVYLSIQDSNTNHQPDISSSFWVNANLKDGDVFYQTPAAGYPSGGSDVGIWQQKAGSLTNLAVSPTVIALTDGQVSPADALTYSASTLTYAKIEYTIKRGSGEGRKHKGTLTILNDASSTVSYSNEFVEIGSDINVPLTVSISSGLVHVQYTSASESVAIQMSYTISGWSG